MCRRYLRELRLSNEGRARLALVYPFPGMLRRLLNDVFRLNDGAQTQAAAPPVAPSVLREQKLQAAHARAPLAEHLAIVFGPSTCNAALVQIVEKAAERTATPIAPALAFKRRQAALNLIAYFLHARQLPGRSIECGTFRGFSALALCQAARLFEPDYSGAGFHVVDSFEGLSEPRMEDHHAVELGAGEALRVPPIRGGGHFSIRLEDVRASLNEFPAVQFHRGWIPAVLDELPQDRWSFVHIDVDLYEPTRACLEYFLPRVIAGGVIVCDDYGSPVFPGAERAWDEVCTRMQVPFVELPTGQAVILKRD
jgi:O-methyltransferase